MSRSANVLATAKMRQGNKESGKEVEASVLARQKLGVATDARYVIICQELINASSPLRPGDWLCSTRSCTFTA